MDKKSLRRNDIPLASDWQPCTTHRFCQVLQRHINIREDSALDLLRPDLHLSIIQNEAAAGHWRNRSLWRLIWRKYMTHLKLNSGVQQWQYVYCRSIVPIGIVSKLVYGGKIWCSLNLGHEKETRICGASKWHLAWTPWAPLGKGMATKGWRIAARNTSMSSVRTYMKASSIPPDSKWNTYLMLRHMLMYPKFIVIDTADSTNTRIKGFKPLKISPTEETNFIAGYPVWRDRIREGLFVGVNSPMLRSGVTCDMVHKCGGRSPIRANFPVRGLFLGRFAVWPSSKGPRKLGPFWISARDLTESSRHSLWTNNLFPPLWLRILLREDKI